MIKSKYLGRVFDSWTVTEARIAGRYGKRNKLKGNSYCFVLTRQTHDGVCMKHLVINHKTMTSLARGNTTMDSVIRNQHRWQGSSKYTGTAYYKFLK